MAQYNQLVITGNGNPNGVINGEVGYLYVDDLTDKQYTSIGGTNWKEKCSECFKDITWAALVTLAVNSRATYYNITDGDPNNLDDEGNPIIYGQVQLNRSGATFYYQETELIIIE